jgi:hypothetical protein
MDFAVNVIRFFCSNTPIVKGKLEEGGNESDEEWQDVVSLHLNRSQSPNEQITIAPCNNVACRSDRNWVKD